MKLTTIFSLLYKWPPGKCYALHIISGCYSRVKKHFEISSNKTTNLRVYNQMLMGFNSCMCGRVYKGEIHPLRQNERRRTS